MTHPEALALIEAGVTTQGGLWLDLGAGTGVFTRALADLLGNTGRVVAIDRRSQFELRHHPGQARIETIQADFRQPLPYRNLDGIIMANALHYVKRQEHLLKQLVSYLKPNAHFILVEYDIKHSSPWIPFPLPRQDFLNLAEKVGLTKPSDIGRRPSRYGPRELYACVARRQTT